MGLLEETAAEVFADEPRPAVAGVMPPSIMSSGGQPRLEAVANEVFGPEGTPASRVARALIRAPKAVADWLVPPTPPEPRTEPFPGWVTPPQAPVFYRRPGATLDSEARRSGLTPILPATSTPGTPFQPLPEKPVDLAAGLRSPRVAVPTAAPIADVTEDVPEPPSAPLAGVPLLTPEQARQVEAGTVPPAPDLAALLRQRQDLGQRADVLAGTRAGLEAATARRQAEVKELEAERSRLTTENEALAALDRQILRDSMLAKTQGGFADQASLDAFKSRAAERDQRAQALRSAVEAHRGRVQALNASPFGGQVADYEREARTLGEQANLLEAPQRIDLSQVGRDIDLGRLGLRLDRETGGAPRGRLTSPIVAPLPPEGPSVMQRLTGTAPETAAERRAQFDETARAYLGRLSRQTGIPVEDLEQRARGALERPTAQITSGLIDSWSWGLVPGVLKALGLEPLAVPEEPSVVETPNALRRVFRGAGQFAGFLTNPIRFGRAATERLFGEALAPMRADPFLAQLAKAVATEASMLASASAAEATGQALGQTSLLDAAKVYGEAAKSGTLLGTIFGSMRGVLPADTLLQRSARVGLGMVALDAARGHHPLDERILAQKAFDYGLNAFFLFHGQDVRRVLDEVRQTARDRDITEDEAFQRVVTDFAKAKVGERTWERVRDTYARRQGLTGDALDLTVTRYILGATELGPRLRQQYADRERVYRSQGLSPEEAKAEALDDLAGAEFGTATPPPSPESPREGPPGSPTGPVAPAPAVSVPSEADGRPIGPPAPSGPRIGLTPEEVADLKEIAARDRVERASEPVPASAPAKPAPVPEGPPPVAEPTEPAVPKAAPVIFRGWQTRGTAAPPLALWDLVEDVPGHPKGSTVSAGTLIGLGYDMPEPPTPPPAPTPLPRPVPRVPVSPEVSSPPRIGPTTPSGTLPEPAAEPTVAPPIPIEAAPASEAAAELKDGDDVEVRVQTAPGQYEWQPGTVQKTQRTQRGAPLYEVSLKGQDPRNTFRMPATDVRPVEGPPTAATETAVPPAEAPPAPTAPIPGEAGAYPHAERLGRLFRDFEQRLEQGTLPRDPRELRRLASQLLGVSERDLAGDAAALDDIYDAIEAATNVTYRATVPPAEAGLPLQIEAGRLAEEALGNRTRTLGISERQQFSTPLPIAAAGVWALDLRPGETVGEPTGGTGNLVAPLPLDTQIRVNELDPRRAETLRLQGYEPTVGDYLAEGFGAGAVPLPDVIHMNPPWGRYSTGRYGRPVPQPYGTPVDVAERFVVRALRDVAPGGRVVAILPTTILESHRFLGWLDKARTLRAIVQNPPGSYDTRGTGVDSVILVVDQGRSPDAPAPIRGTAADWADLARLLEPLASGGTHARIGSAVGGQPGGAPGRPETEPPPAAPQPDAGGGRSEDTGLAPGLPSGGGRSAPQPRPRAGPGVVAPGGRPGPSAVPAPADAELPGGPPAVGGDRESRGGERIPGPASTGPRTGGPPAAPSGTGGPGGPRTAGGLTASTGPVFDPTRAAAAFDELRELLGGGEPPTEAQEGQAPYFPPNLALLPKVVEAGGGLWDEGFQIFEPWAAEMERRIGPRIRPYLDGAFRMIQAHVGLVRPQAAEGELAGPRYSYASAEEFEAAQQSPLFAPVPLRAAPGRQPHPRLVVATRSLAGASLPPLTYQLQGSSVMAAYERGAISDQQLDYAILPALQANTRRRGYLMAADVGVGKALPLDAPVLTPNGWVAMGDLAVGDEVIAADGQPTPVLGVYPQGKRLIYRVTFSDGATVECDDEHLWLTTTNYERNNERRYPHGRTGTVRTLAEIRTTLHAPTRAEKNHRIPMVAPVKFTSRPVDIDPYALGVLLGDGCLRQGGVGFTTADEDIARRIATVMPSGVEIRHRRRYRYDISGQRGARGRFKNPVLEALRADGLAGCRSYEKHVPARYLFNDAAVRLGVLRGLMDTDGYVDMRGMTPIFTTTSRQLAADVVFLVQSLGGVAVIRTKRATSYRHHGERRPSRPAFNVSVTLPSDINPFWLPRKAARIRPKTKYPPRRYIVAVDPIGVKLAQCVRVAAPDGLFVIDGFVVTHNSRAAAAIIAEWLESEQANRVVLIAPNEINEEALLREFREFAGGEYPFPIVRLRGMSESKDRPGQERQPLPRHDRAVYLVDRYNFAAFARSLEELEADAVVADEAHLLKNVEGADVGVAWLNFQNGLLTRRGKFVYTTATPAVEFDDLAQMVGFREWTYDTWEDYKRRITGGGRQGIWDDYNRLRGLVEQAPGIPDDLRAETLRATEIPGDIQDSDSLGAALADAVNQLRDVLLEHTQALDPTTRLPGRPPRQQRRQRGDLFSARITPAEQEQIMREFAMRGLYYSVDLWRAGVEFNIGETPLTPAQHEEYEALAALFRDIADTWDKYQRMNRLQGGRSFGTRAALQAEAKQRLFDYRLGPAIEAGKAALARGEQPVLSLISVSGQTKERGNITSLIQRINARHIEVDDNGDVTDHGDIPEALQDIARLLDTWGGIRNLPDPIERLEEAFGREHLVIITGKVSPKQRDRQIREFQAGQRRVAVISEAGTTGISLHHVLPIEGEARGRRHLIAIDYPWSSVNFKQALGRSLSLDTPVLTPRGWKPMGAIRVGDEVVGADGNPTVVLGVYPQPPRQLYCVMLNDGAQVECDEEHLWLTWTDRERMAACQMRAGVVRRPGTADPKVRTLAEIRTTLSSNAGRTHNHQIPIVAAVKFAPRAVPIDPYLLGLLLGDGHIGRRETYIASVDAEIVASVGRLVPEPLIVRKTGIRRYSIVTPGGRGSQERNTLTGLLRTLGLSGHRAWEKFVPDDYKLNDRETRLAVLQGLLDTDGSASLTRGVTFFSSSRRLGEDVQFLARSLGGLAAIKEEPAYERHGRPRRAMYRVRLSLPLDVIPFRLSRKAARIADRHPRNALRRHIVAVEPTRTAPAQCIAVAAPDGLFVVDGFVVTHNTDRSGQISAPAITALSTGSAGERKFLATIANRMKGLGALSKGSAESASNDKLTEFELGGSLDLGAMREAYRDAPRDLQTALIGHAWRVYLGNDPQTRQPIWENARQDPPADASLRDFLLDLQFMPQRLGDQLFERFWAARERLISEEQGHERETGRTRSAQAAVVRSTPLSKDLTLHELREDRPLTSGGVGHHRFGLLQGLITPRIKAIQPFLPTHRLGDRDLPLRRYVTINAGEGAQLAGLEVRAGAIVALKRVFGQGAEAYDTPEKVLEALQAGDTVPLDTDKGWTLKRRPSDGLLQVVGAKMADKDLLQRAGAHYRPVGNLWHVPPEALPAFLERFPAKQSEPPDLVQESRAAYGAAEAEPEPELAPPFFLASERVVEQKMPAAAFPPQVRGLLRAGGVKEGELKWSGIEAWLDARGGRKVSQAEVLDYLRENNVRVEEVVHEQRSNLERLADLEAQLADAERRVEEARAASPGIKAGDRVATVGSAGSRGGYSYSQGKILEAQPRRRDGVLIWRLVDTFGGTRSGRSARFIQELKDAAPYPWSDAAAHNNEVGEQAPIDAALAAEVQRLQDQIRRAGRGRDTTKFAQFTLRGAVPGTYRELLLTLPKRGPVSALRRLKDELARRYSPDWRYELLAPEDQARLDAFRGAEGIDVPDTQNYRSPHWAEPNVLAHVRFDERTDAQGRRTLFVEEIQSDWGQEIRRKGGVRTTALPPGWRVEPEVLGERGERWVVRDDTGRTIDEGPTREEAERRGVAWVNREHEGVSLPPPMPFAKTWHETAFRRMVRWAAEHGYDQLAWTTGAQQADRYDLSKHVSRVQYVPDSQRLRAFDLAGRAAIDQEGVAPDDLADYIGKEAAEKLLAAPTYESASGETVRTLEGLDLKVGSEGMIVFYDRILPEYANRFGKRWGARVGEAAVGTENTGRLIPDSAGGVVRAPGGGVKRERVHSFPITPEMRRSVLSEGVSLFAPRARYTVREGEDAEQAHRLFDEAARDLLRATDDRPRASARGTGEKGPVPPEGRERDRGAERPVLGPPATGPYGAGSGVRTLALALARDLANLGRVDLRGRFAPAADALGVLAQVWRDPRYETLRIVYTDEAGRILAHEALTSRAPAAAQAFVSDPARFAWDLRDRMRRLGAARYYLLHNHPSTKTAPSEVDLQLTVTIAARVPGFGGHVIIDHDTFSVIEPPTTSPATVREVPIPARPDARYVPAVPHDVLGAVIARPDDVAQLGRALQVRTGWVALLHRDSAGRVRAAQEMPRALFLRAPDAADFIRGQQRRAGAQDTFAFFPAIDPAVAQAGADLMRQGALEDVVVGRRSAMSEGIHAARPAVHPPIRVEEPPADYRPAGFALQRDGRDRATLPADQAAELAADLQDQGQEVEVRPVNRVLRQVWARPTVLSSEAPAPERPPQVAESIERPTPAAAIPGPAAAPPAEPPGPPAPPTEEAAAPTPGGRFPREATRETLDRLTTEAARMAPPDRQALAEWARAQEEALEREGRELADWCLENGGRFTIQ